MKKLALLMFAILILGCDIETTVIEETPPVIEEPPLRDTVSDEAKALIRNVK